jgi:mannose-6-phosphate isomerase
MYEPLNEPFLLTPAFKEKIWGGSTLSDDFSKQTDFENLGETWECSTHNSGASIVIGGEHDGKTLCDVLNSHPEYLGLNSNGKLPIMVKLIDAKDDLSVQVHPGDKYAMQFENGSMGKTEMWYVLDAKPDAELVYGFSQKISKSRLIKSIENGTVSKYMNRVKVHKNDVFFIEAGTVHAIGKGIVVAEIQENSDLTYRLYDYDRKDKNGNKRELHIDKALDVINFNPCAEPRQPLRVLKYQKGSAYEFLCRCKYFQVERLLINTEKIKQMSDFKTNEYSFQVLLCTDGCGVLFEKNGQFINFFKGDCIFVPANSVDLKLHGKAELLKISC